LITNTPKRGEIWLINFDPSVGAEIRKTRPGVIISSNATGKLPIKLTAPITEWKNYFTGNFWHVKVEPDDSNSLTKISAIDTLQIRGIDIKRFIRKIGNISNPKMQEITLAIATIIEYSN
jgi:mRNA interferase MazF